jgi:hypothetical protein
MRSCLPAFKPETMAYLGRCSSSGNLAIGRNAFGLSLMCVTRSGLKMVSPEPVGVIGKARSPEDQFSWRSPRGALW